MLQGNKLSQTNNISRKYNLSQIKHFARRKLISNQTIFQGYDLSQTILQGYNLSQTNNIATMQLISTKQYCKDITYLKQTILPRIQLISNKEYCKDTTYLKQTYIATMHSLFQAKQYYKDITYLKQTIFQGYSLSQIRYFARLQAFLK